MTISVGNLQQFLENCNFVPCSLFNAWHGCSEKVLASGRKIYGRRKVYA